MSHWNLVISGVQELYTVPQRFLLHILHVFVNKMAHLLKGQSGICELHCADEGIELSKLVILLFVLCSRLKVTIPQKVCISP